MRKRKPVTLPTAPDSPFLFSQPQTQSDDADRRTGKPDAGHQEPGSPR